MSTVTATAAAANSGLSTIAANPAGYTAKATKKVLDADDFMKLLSTQMANQDPMKPMEDTAFISQMSAFSSLASQTQMSKDFTAMRADMAKSTANSFIGSTVTVQGTDASVAAVTGQVTGVDNTGTEPLLIVGDKTYTVSQVQKVQLPSTTTTTGTGS